ncbi:MAG: LysM domain-containing protein [Acidimicrobiia bacterium]
MGAGSWGPEGTFDEHGEWVRPVRSARPQRGPGASDRRVGGSGGWSPGGSMGALPAIPTLLIASVVVVFAFVLGRATGGDTVVRKVVAAQDAATTTTGVPVQHTVVRGETLFAIANKYGVLPDALAAANGITDFNQVLVGQVLLVPAPAPAPVAVTTTTKAKQ